VANLEVADVSYHVCQQRVAGDVEWNSETLGGGGNENSGLWENWRQIPPTFVQM
jgi:hypothetical protein